MVDRLGWVVNWETTWFHFPDGIRARKGPIIALGTEGDKAIKNVADDVIYLPPTLDLLNPILATVPLQLFAYHIAVARGCDVDKPRNLAKSVTVE